MVFTGSQSYTLINRQVDRDMAFSLSIADSSRLIGIPASRLRCRLKNLDGSWSRRKGTRLAMAEILALAVIDHYCTAYQIKSASFSESTDWLVAHFNERKPLDLNGQWLLFQWRTKSFRAVARGDVGAEEIVEENWLAIDLDRALEGVWGRFFSDELVKGTRD